MYINTRNTFNQC